MGELIKQLQKIIDELRAGKVSDDTPAADLPEHYLPYLRTVLDVVCPGKAPNTAELLRLRDVTIELVDMLV